MSVWTLGASASESADYELAELKRRLARAETQLEARDREADELNHRIANSLALASSFLILQQKRLENQTAKAALAMASARVTAIAQVHRHLAGHGSASRVDFGKFLEDLGPEMASSTGMKCEIDAEPVDVSGETAVQLAVAVNELVINAGKHAYATGEDGHVRIECRQQADGRLYLSVADGGFGLPDGFDIDGANGLGMEIVSGIVRQLGGEIRADNDHGARFVFIVPRAIDQFSSRAYSDSGTP